MQLVSGVAKLGMYIKKYIWQLCRNSFHRLRIAKKYLSLAVFATFQINLSTTTSSIKFKLPGKGFLGNLNHFDCFCLGLLVESKLESISGEQRCFSSNARSAFKVAVRLSHA